MAEPFTVDVTDRASLRRFLDDVDSFLSAVPYWHNPAITDVAIEALKEFVQRHPGKIDSLLRHAKVDRVERVIRPYLESVA